MVSQGERECESLRISTENRSILQENLRQETASLFSLLFREDSGKKRRGEDVHGR